MTSNIDFVTPIPAMFADASGVAPKAAVIVLGAFLIAAFVAVGRDLFSLLPDLSKDGTAISRAQNLMASAACLTVAMICYLSLVGNWMS